MSGLSQMVDVLSRLIVNLVKMTVCAVTRAFNWSAKSSGSIVLDAFLADDINIWQAARYRNPGAVAAAEKIPPLIKGDNSATEGKIEQVAELLKTFFPPLPTVIEDEGERPQRPPVEMPRLIRSEGMESTRRRRPTSRGMEADMAYSEGPGAAALPDITGLRGPYQPSGEMRKSYLYESRITSSQRRTGPSHY
jgi:hypothetical protein